MQAKLEALRGVVLAALNNAQSLAELDELEDTHLSRKSEFSTMMKSLGTLDPEARKAFGTRANVVKEEIMSALEARRSALRESSFASLAESEWADVTVPGLEPAVGHQHLVSQAITDVTEIFERIGFSRVSHPEVEWDWYAFEALNMQGDHPARDDWETFFIDAPISAKMGRMLLTPHTTSGDVREMEKRQLPIRMMNISKTYRRQIDVTHVPMFHQFEGLLVDKNVSLAHLRGVLDYFAKAFFGPNRKTRLRPHHFRFTEPSFEVDISCGICGGTGKLPEGGKCRLCKEGWLELGGAGMLHPNVLRAGKLDPDEYSALAFGWGVERTMMMKSGVMLDDIRELYRNDLRFLRQF